MSDSAATLIVDGANVMGSRPDGWWKDRAAAARRLHAQLAAAELGFDRVQLVLEGRARAGVPAGQADGVDTVHALRDGDSTIVELCRTTPGPHVVVTADRGLTEAAQSAGATVRRPGWLLRLIESAATS